MALIGQRGFGGLAPQRVEAIASLRPAPSHQITASVGYGEIAYGKPRMLRADGIEPDFDNNSVIAICEQHLVLLLYLQRVFN